MADDNTEGQDSGTSFPLSGLGLRNWLVTAGRFLFHEFSSGDDLLTFLRDNDVAIRTQDFYSIRQSVLATDADVVNKEVSLTVLGDQDPDSLVPLGYTVFEHQMDLSQNFLYRFSIESINKDTGEVQTDFMAVGSDIQLTFNEARDQLGSLFTGEYVQDGFTVTDIALNAAFGRPEML